MPLKNGLKPCKKTTDGEGSKEAGAGHHSSNFKEATRNLDELPDPAEESVETGAYWKG